MKSLLIVCAFLVLSPTALLAQKVSPLIVETLQPTPTVVKTGEPFQEIYRVRFLDLGAQGKEISILLDEIKPGGAQAPTFSPFEVVNLDVKTRKVGDESVWDFIYTLRIVDPRKGDYRIPKIKFYWVIKGAGAVSKGSKDASVREFETEEVPITYVTTLTRDTRLDIRDTADFGNFRKYRYAFRIFSLLLFLLVAAYFVKIAIRFLWPKNDDLESISEYRGEILPQRTYHEFRRGLRELEKSSLALNSAEGDPEKRMRIEEKCHELTRMLLLIEAPSLSWSSTPRELRSGVNNLKEGWRKELLSGLADRLVAYDVDIESGVRALPVIPMDDVRILRSFYQKLWWRRWIR